MSNIGAHGFDDARACETKDPWIVTWLQAKAVIELVAVDRDESRISSVDENIVWSRSRSRKSYALENANSSGSDAGVSRHIEAIDGVCPFGTVHLASASRYAFICKHSEYASFR